MKVGTIQLPLLVAFAVGVVLTIIVFSFAFLMGQAATNRPPSASLVHTFATLTPDVASPTPPESAPPSAAVAGSQLSAATETLGVPDLPVETVVPSATPRPLIPTSTPLPVDPTVIPLPINPTETTVPIADTPTALPAPPTQIPLPPTAVPAAAPAPVAGEALASAIRLVASKGYTVVDAVHYYPPGPLHVLIGTRTGTTDGHDMRAFVFDRDVWLGTDTDTPSASITVTARTADSVTLTYALYHPTDLICCPTAGTGSTLFLLANGRFRPQQPIPSGNPNDPTSRR